MNWISSKLMTRWRNSFFNFGYPVFGCIKADVCIYMMHFLAFFEISKISIPLHSSFFQSSEKKLWESVKLVGMLFSDVCGNICEKSAKFSDYQIIYQMLLKFHQMFLTIWRKCQKPSKYGAILRNMSVFIEKLWEHLFVIVQVMISFSCFQSTPF